MKVFSVEKANKEIEDHLKNLTDVKKKMETESQLQIADLMEQLTIFEEVKEKEVGELNRKYSEALSRMNSAENSSESNLMAVQRREAELLLQIKELEVKEAEMTLLTQSLRRKNQELEEMKVTPRFDSAGDTDTEAQIQFLNSIIADMQKKNMELTSQVELLVMGSATAADSG
jgi:CAP-Gly domain-containing linker protein 1